MSNCAVLLHTFYLLGMLCTVRPPRLKTQLGPRCLGNLSCPLVPTRRPHLGYLPCVHGTSNPSSPLLSVFQVPSTEKMLNKYLPNRLEPGRTLFFPVMTDVRGAKKLRFVCVCVCVCVCRNYLYEPFWIRFHFCCLFFFPKHSEVEYSFLMKNSSLGLDIEIKMYVYIYTYRCICEYTYTYTHIYLCVYIWSSAHKHMHICVPVYTYVCVYE